MLKDKVVLITQLRLSDFTGSEVVTLELVNALSAMVKKVYVVTTSFDDPVRSEFEKIKNVTVLNINDEKLTRILDRKIIDFAWIHHSLIPSQLLEKPGTTKFIFHHMSPFAEFESPLFPVIEKTLASAILCNSSETMKSFLGRGIFTANDGLKIFNNPAPKKFDTANQASENLRSLLVVSNHIPSDLRQAIEIVRGEGVRVDIVGVGDDNYRLITPKDLRDHDAVVSIGKTVQYAILSNRPAYCYDKFGGPGYLTEKNFAKAKELNFSGRGFTKRDPDAIAKEILTNFMDASHYANYLYEHERETFTLDIRLQGVLKNLASVSSSRKVPIDLIESYKTLSKMLFVDQPSIRHLHNIEKKSDKAHKEVQDLKHELLLSRIEAHSIQDSRAYKIGRMLTLPVRTSKHAARRILSPYLTRKVWVKMWQTTKSAYGLTDNSYRRETVQLVIRSYYHPTSSTFIRMISPFATSVLAGKYKLSLVDGDNIRSLRKAGRVVIVQRTSLPSVEDAKWLIRFVKSNNMRLYVDSDDAFSELDKKHSQYELQKERVDALNYVMKHADKVWFSTVELSKLYGIDNSIVIGNTIDEKVWPRLKNNIIDIPETSSPLRMVYMGTATHGEDFEMILPVLHKLHNAYPASFELYVVGVSADTPEYPWLKRLTPEGALYPDFATWFGSLDQFDIGLSPLTHSAFNKSKSDIKCLDYIANGIKPIVSDVPAYQNPGLDPYVVRVTNTEESWYGQLESEVVNTTKNRKQMDIRVKAGYAYLKTFRKPDIAANQILGSLEVKRKAAGSTGDTQAKMVK